MNFTDSKKKILVVGGAGFIGSHLCSRLVESGNSVICIDNISGGEIKNVIYLIKSKRFKFFEHDIINPIDIKVDQIYHLASHAYQDPKPKNPIIAAKTNVLGTINLLKLANKYKIPILLASTCEIYGYPQKTSIDEKFNGQLLNSFSKNNNSFVEGIRMMESIGMDYSEYKNLVVKIVRIFNAYGPKMPEIKDQYIKYLIKQALTNDNIIINLEKNSIFSTCFGDDVVEGLIKTMNSDSISEIINIGSDENITIQYICDLIIEFTNSKSKIIFKSDPNKLNYSWIPDISLAKKKIKWQPKTKFLDGISITIDYYTK